MRRIHRIKPTEIEKNVMEKVTKNIIVMKPRWLFVFGSTAMVFGLVGLGILAIFLTNLAVFLLKQHGPNGEWRLQLILDSFPVWVPIIAIAGFILGVWMLKKYDFSYKKNFLSIILTLIISIILIAFLLDYTGLNNIWMKRGPMRQFYQQVQGQNKNISKGGGQVNGVHIRDSR